MMPEGGGRKSLGGALADRRFFRVVTLVFIALTARGGRPLLPPAEGSFDLVVTCDTVVVTGSGSGCLAVAWSSSNVESNSSWALEGVGNFVRRSPKSSISLGRLTPAMLILVMEVDKDAVADQVNV